MGFSTYNEGRLFAYLLGLKDPKFIAAYGGAELDPALERGEIDARATGPDTLLQRNAEWLEKGFGGDSMRSWKLPRGISILIQGSAVCPRSRALPNRIENAKWFSCSALSGLAARPLFCPREHPKIG